jgi:hypothetical protein
MNAILVFFRWMPYPRRADRLGLASRVVVPSGVTRLFPDLVYRVRPAVDAAEPRFLHYALISRLAKAQIQAARRGAANSKLRVEDVCNLRVPACPIGQQQTISDYLDRECGWVASLGDDMDQLVALAEESWLAAAREVIGFDRHDSVQIRHVATTGTGHTPSRVGPEWWVASECGIPWFTLTDVHQIRDHAVDTVLRPLSGSVLPVWRTAQLCCTHVARRCFRELPQSASPRSWAWTWRFPKTS